MFSVIFSSFKKPREVLISEGTFLEGSQNFTSKEREAIRKIARTLNPNETVKLTVDFTRKSFSYKVIDRRAANVFACHPDLVKAYSFINKAYPFLTNREGTNISFSKQNNLKDRLIRLFN